MFVQIQRVFIYIGQCVSRTRRAIYSTRKLNVPEDLNLLRMESFYVRCFFEIVEIFRVAQNVRNF
jgi:hypothetical protein